MEEKSPRDNVDAQEIVEAIRFKSLRKLMSLVQTSTYHNMDEYMALAEYFPSICDAFPEYHDITKAFVDAFEANEMERMRKRATLSPLKPTKGNRFNEFMKRVKKSTIGKDNVFIKLNAGKLFPIVLHFPNGKPNFLHYASERLSRTFTVHNFGRRFNVRITGRSLRKIRAEKVEPALGECVGSGEGPMLTHDYLAKVAAMFCVESAKDAKARRKLKPIERKSENVVKRKHEGYGSFEFADYIDEVEEFYYDSDDESVDLPIEAMSDSHIATYVNGLEQKKDGRISRCITSMRKMFKKKDH